MECRTTLYCTGTVSELTLSHKKTGSDFYKITRLVNTGPIQDHRCVFEQVLMMICCLALRLPGGGAMLGAAHVVTTSVGMCDVDLRYSILSFLLSWRYSQ